MIASVVIDGVNRQGLAHELGPSMMTVSLQLPVNKQLESIMIE